MRRRLTHGSPRGHAPPATTPPHRPQSIPGELPLVWVSHVAEVCIRRPSRPTGIGSNIGNFSVLRVLVAAGGLGRQRTSISKVRAQPLSESLWCGRRTTSPSRRARAVQLRGVRYVVGVGSLTQRLWPFLTLAGVNSTVQLQCRVWSEPSTPSQACRSACAETSLARVRLRKFV